MAYIHEPSGDIMSEMKLTDSIFGRPLGNVSMLFKNNMMIKCKQLIETEEKIQMFSKMTISFFTLDMLLFYNDFHKFGIFFKSVILHGLLGTSNSILAGNYLSKESLDI